MNYKKIIKNRDARMKVLRIFDWVPDKAMIRLQYRIKLGRKLDLKNPQRYTEKLQWYKLYHRDPLMRQCSDKAEVRDYVKSKGLKDILTKCYGIYNDCEEIDFDKLPNKFVIKDTLGGGSNAVIIIKNKKSADIGGIKNTLNSWTIIIERKNPGREWTYENKQHKILIEELINSRPEDGGLIDYKFFCFGGKAKYLYAISDREVGKNAAIGIYDMNFKRLNYVYRGKVVPTRAIKKPSNFSEMKKIAEQLSKDFPHGRVDLYNVDGKIIFGELTFFSGSGYMQYEPDEFDFIMGKEFNIEGIK